MVRIRILTIGETSRKKIFLLSSDKICNVPLFDLGVGGQAVEKKMGFETYALGFGGG
jgi:hypothetical protein